MLLGARQPSRLSAAPRCFLPRESLPESLHYLPSVWCSLERSSLNLGLFIPEKMEFLETPGEIPITTSSVPENALTVNTDLILCLETYIQKQNKLFSSRNDIKWFWRDDLDNFEVPSYVIYDFVIFSYAFLKTLSLCI